METRVITYTYDPLYRLTSAEYSTGESFAYVYDAVGNRLSLTTMAGVVNYQYDAANRLVLSEVEGLTSVDGVAYTWDNNGNLLSDGVFTYTYDAANRLVRAQSVTTTLVYTYNADGLRVAQSVDGVETAFTWDLAAGLAEVLSTSGAMYLHGLDLTAEQRSGAWWYPLGDALGSVRQWTDSGGSVTYAGGYTPFGVELWREGNTASAWGYTGEWWDADAALLYLQARWYAPGTGRFTQRDVWGGDYWRPLTLNPYLYVIANPVSATDPSGRSPVEIPCSQDGCDPNGEAATRWLVEAMRTNAVSLQARTIRGLNVLASTAIVPGITPVPIILPPLPPVVTPCAMLSIPPKALAYLMWIEMVKTNAPWDFKKDILNAQGEFAWGGQNIRMCCDWYWYEAVANIHYGYVGKAAGFTDFELKAGAGAAQYQEYRNAEWYRERIAAGEVGWHTYYDEPEDQAGIQIGLDLYNGGAFLTPEKFCEVFNRWATQLKPARWWDTAPLI